MENIFKFLNSSSSSRFIPIFLIVVLLISSFAAYGDQKTDNKPAASSRFRSIKYYIQNRMKSTRTPSISVAVAQEGKIAWEESFGWANREKQIEATPQTIYSLPSISKPMTATAMMILVERGLIDLNEPVNSYLGDSRLTAYEGNAADATIARLMHHTAGLPTIWNFYFDGAQINRPCIPESIKQYGILTSPPGTVYEYSNLGYGIAEYIIERVSGKSFAQFMKSEVFKLLGMNRSFVATEKFQYDSIAARYIENKNVSPFFDVMSRGGGGISASVHDLLLFGMFHLKNHLPDQKQICSDSTIDYMQSCVDPLVPDSPYKLGWDVKEMFGYRVVNHGGGMPGVSSALLLVPSENIAIAILCNGTYIDLYKIGQLILVRMLPKKKVKQKTISKKNETGDLNVQFPSQKYVGQWDGEIKTDKGHIPVSLDIDEAGKVTLTLIDEGRKCLPVETFRYNKGTLNGSFDFDIPTKDASACRHKVYMRLKLHGNRLSGYAAAVSYRVEVFHLPYYIAFEKRSTLYK